MFAKPNNNHGWKTELCVVCSNAFTLVAFGSIQIQQIADPFGDDTWYWVFGALILLTALLLAVGCYFRNKEQHEQQKSNS